MSIRKLFSSNSPDVLPLAEQVLEDLVRLEFRCFWLVDLPPEEFVTLESGDEAGFGKAMLGHCSSFADEPKQAGDTSGSGRWSS